MADSKSLMVGIAAIVVAIVSIIIASISLIGPLEEVEEDEEEYRPQIRESFIFTQVDENIEETTSIPPDMFSQDTIVVRQGDTVKVHFYNLEPIETQEHHTFTVNDPAYKIHHDLNAGEDTVIEFTASKSGIFDYLCTYHQPTMRGKLVVLPP
jgi:plastocyanin